MTLGVHFSETNNLAIDAKIFAPTGAFETRNLSNLGMKEWTFMPNITHTYLIPKRGIEFTNNIGFDIYTTNPINNYKSGTIFHWDGLLMQYLSKHSGVGAIVSNVTQLTNDTGPFTDKLNGFKMGTYGAGAIGFYVIKVGKTDLACQFRWIKQFDTVNTTNGSVLLLGVTAKL